MEDTRTFPPGWTETEPYHAEKHLTKARRDSKAPDYLRVAERLVWFNHDQRALIAAGKAVTTFYLNVNPIEIDYEKKYAVFKASVRDVLGNEAEDYGSESIQDFPDWLEKAATKATGRALAKIGYGTAYAPELDEGHRIVDTPREPRPQQPVSQQPQRAQQQAAPRQPQPAAAGQGKPAVQSQLDAIARLCGQVGDELPDPASFTYDSASAKIRELSDKLKNKTKLAAVK